VGFGSLFISWMNDSGFWVVVRMSGFTEKEGLKTWTTLLAILSLVGLIQVLLLSWLFPLV
jgi:GntP family gluconate:H+ symporter